MTDHQANKDKRDSSATHRRQTTTFSCLPSRSSSSVSVTSPAIRSSSVPFIVLLRGVTVAAETCLRPSSSSSSCKIDFAAASVRVRDGVDGGGGGPNPAFRRGMSDSLLTPVVVVVVEADASPANESWYDMDAFRLEATLDRVVIWRPLPPPLLVGKPDAALPLLLKDRELAPLGRMVVAPPAVLAREEGRFVALLSEDDDGFVGELGRDDASGRRCCLRGEEVDDGVEGLANAIDACAVLLRCVATRLGRRLMKATTRATTEGRSPCSGSRRRANRLRHTVSDRGIEVTSERDE